MVANRIGSAVLLAAAALLLSPAAPAQDHDAARAALVEELAGASARLQAHAGVSGFSDAVLAAIGRVARHAFVPEQQRRHAYANRPLPIGHGQTISQPYIVALMTELLQLQPDDVVLEVGAGSGYHAAVIAELVHHVYTIEIIEPLGAQARDRLDRLGFDNVTVRVADGYYGWPEHAPFDGIVVTAAATQIPPPLIRQLAPGGRMVIPVGSPFMTQQLMLVERQPDGSVRSRQIMPVRFVPLTGVGGGTGTGTE